MLYLKNKKSIVLYILLFFSPFTIGSMIWLLSTSNIFSPELIETLHIINGSVAFITAPLACIKIVGFQIKKSSRNLMVFLIIVALFSLITNLYMTNTAIVTITLILRFSGLVFVYSLLLKNRKYIRIDEIKVFYNSMLLSVLVLLVVLFCVIAVRFYNQEIYQSIKRLPMDQIFAITLSSLISLFLIHFFFISDTQPRFERNLDSFKLTPREKEIITLILNGYTSKEASQLLNISQQTVKNHTANVYRKLEINSKLELFQLILDF